MVSKGSSFSLCGYTDSDWDGDKDDRKPTFRAYQVLGRSSVCWSSKKQSCICLSIAEAEYVAAESECTQLLWMRQTLKKYDVNCDKMPILCDNESAIKIAYSLVHHRRTKHI